jgi:glutathione S-transferase
MNTLFYSPGACSLGIHVILEEIGAPYALEKVSLADGAQYKPDYVAITPKSKVPALRRADGSVLTEFPAIAYWLAATNPGSNLWPTEAAAQAAVLETIDYCVATLHMQGFARIFRPGNFAPDEASHEAVKARGRQILDNGFALLDGKLAARDWVAGTYSIADAALFYVAFWVAARLKADLPSNVAAHLDRMLARPAVKAMMQQEGLSL